MTKELARQLQARRGVTRELSNTQETALLMDWLAGRTYEELAEKYGVNKNKVMGIIKAARKTAANILEQED